MNESVLGLLLAGGQSRRMGGGDKCLRELAGKTLLQRIVERVQPQVGQLLLNANGDPARFAAFDLPIVEDVVDGFAGPLAGILTGLRWAQREAPQCCWVLSVPTDAPFLPLNLVARMLNAVADGKAELACAFSNGRTHPVVGLWRVDLADALEEALVKEDMRKIDRWTARYRLAVVEFDTNPIDPFFNTNRPEDLAEAARLLAP
ncbi:MAG: molybdenum cofactor guanylyltransferase MobA [Rickettsiales bacterium]